MLRSVFLATIAAVLLSSASAAAPKPQVLYETSIDLNKNGIADQAMLILLGPGRTDFSETTKDTYMLSDDERVDLYIFLDRDNSVSLTDEPDLHVENIVTPDGLRFAFPLQGKSNGALNVITSNGFGNTFNLTETLTLVFRDERFLVAGWARDFYNSRDDQSRHCSVNFLTGKAVKRSNGGKDFSLEGDFKPLEVADWSEAMKPTACEDQE